LIDDHKNDPKLKKRWIYNIRNKLYCDFYLGDNIEKEEISNSPPRVVEKKETKYVSPKKQVPEPTYISMDYEKLKSTLQNLHCPNECSISPSLKIMHTTFKEKNTKFHIVCSKCDQYLVYDSFDRNFTTILGGKEHNEKTVHGVLIYLMNNINSQKSKRIEELSENSNTNKERKEHICKVALKLAKRDSKERLNSTLESSEDIGLVSDGQWQGYNSDSFWYHMQDGNTKKIVAFSILQKNQKIPIRGSFTFFKINGRSGF
jgi:hypothetical protein